MAGPLRRRCLAVPRLAGAPERRIAAPRRAARCHRHRAHGVRGWRQPADMGRRRSGEAR